MLFHITYTLSPTLRDAATARFKETSRLPEGVEMIGRWHCAEGLSGFIVVESPGVLAISRWLSDWTDLIAFKVSPVLTDQQWQEIYAK